MLPMVYVIIKNVVMLANQEPLRSHMVDNHTHEMNIVVKMKIFVIRQLDWYKVICILW